ncbi:unnamed protein product [Bubo scandiacus]
MPARRTVPVPVIRRPQSLAHQLLSSPSQFVFMDVVLLGCVTIPWHVPPPRLLVFLGFIDFWVCLDFCILASRSRSLPVPQGGCAACSDPLTAVGHGEQN